MEANDPRHGENRGYLAGCRESCCRAAHANYRRTLRTRQYLSRGNLRLSPTGTRRRIQALCALGWNLTTLDQELGVKRSYTSRLLYDLERGFVTVATAQKIAQLYDRLSMQLPDTSTVARRQAVTRAQNIARRNGWVPPLAWDDIDNDPAPAIVERCGNYEDSIDHAVVQRVIDERRRPRKLTRAESAECVRLLVLSGLSTFSIENDYGFKVERYWRAAA